MIYFENASYGEEGFNTHVMSFTLCTALSNFLGRDFEFDFEVPSSSPPDFASKPDLQDKFQILLNSKRSNVSDLLCIPSRRVPKVDRSSKGRLELQLVHSHFITTKELEDRFAGTMIWDSFSMGRHGHSREELNGFDLIEWTHTKLSTPAFFFFLPKREKTELLSTVHLNYLAEIERLAEQVASELGMFNAAHIRVGDFLKNYSADEYSINVERFREYATANFADPSLPLVLATDGLEDKEIFRSIFPDTQLTFIDEFIFDNFGQRFRILPFTDFNVLTILDQLICSRAETFIGTFRSTFTGIIHRLRQERYSKKDLNFFPDGRVVKQIDENMKIVPDKAGFFDWNRYSALAPDHVSAAWLREWDHDLTALDI